MLPSFEAIFRAISRVSSKVDPCRITLAPYPLVASIFAGDTLSGMTMVDLVSRRVAACATPWAWFPAEEATTPLLLSESESE